jgi:hypothetical protein
VTTTTNHANVDEGGFAMITAVTLTMVMALLGAVILTNGSHADRASGHGRNWDQALHVAEAGVEQAVATMQASSGAVPAPVAGASGGEGTYDTAVTYLGRNRYQIDASGDVGKSDGLRATRKVRVVYGPPRSFRYALFSLTDVDTKNNDIVVGDVWANGNVTVQQNDEVHGSATAATGGVYLDNHSKVTGDVWSGGAGATGIAVDVSTGARIDGKVKASSTAPGCTDDPGHQGYKVNVVGSIGGSVTTWGVKTGGGSTGAFTANSCTNAAPSKPIPTFTYNPVNYTPAPVEFASPAAFDAYLNAGHRANLSGTFHIAGGGAASAIDLTGVQISGDTTIVATQAPIDANGVGAANNADKLLVLVSYYQPPAASACTDNGGNPQDCAIGLKNNFIPGDHSAVMLYAPNGPVAFKNNADFLGAVYANDIVLKNNQTTTYDPRVDQIVGFGPVTLEQESWIETT